jgi:transcriptional regulator with XRE-family HTH domain
MKQRVPAGRPERPIDADSPLAEFATGLRSLRAAADLTVRDLAELTGYSASAISAAASGLSLPSLPLTLAFARTCGGDPDAWAKVWQQLAIARQPPRVNPSSATAKDNRDSNPVHGKALAAPSPRADRDGEWPGHTAGHEPAVRQDQMARVATPSGLVVGIPVGKRLVFGRGSGADLTLMAGPGLSRRAGVISAVADGVWIANISRTHALYAEGKGYRIRLPRMEYSGEPPGGWFLRSGMVLVGSRAMLDDGQALSVMVAGDIAEWSIGYEAAQQRLAAGDETVLPLYLDPMTKLFLVALLWCRPWLLDPAATEPLPRTPEIARAALEVTGASRGLERFDVDPAFRDRLSARVSEQIKVLRRKIAERGLIRSDVRLSDEVVVRALIEHGIITVADLSHLSDPSWSSRQEDLWWT